MCAVSVERNGGKKIMFTIMMIAVACVAASVGTGAVISKKRFNKKLSDIDVQSTESVAQDESLSTEIKRFEDFKINLEQVRENVEKLDIPTPDEHLTHIDDAESSLNKVSKFLEKYSTYQAGTEAVILSILPVSQTGEALFSFASVAPDLISDAFSNSLAALHFPSFDHVSDCLSKFCEGIAHTNPMGLTKAIEHHDYMKALWKVGKNPLSEMTGFHDATGALSESVHDMGETLSNASELSIDPTDLTDLDFSGHIPVMTIAMSSFREFNLLMDNKTDAFSSLKNIGLDAAGAGGGGLVGAKAGALAGSLFGPVGTLVGGIIGGIGGAMGGRAITNEIKQKPLKNAIEDYQTNAARMKSETKEQSRGMLQNIDDFTTQKRQEFKTDKLLKEIPVVENQNTIIGITLIIYQAVSDHLEVMKQKVAKMKSSIWYREDKYGVIIQNYENHISNIERQLPPMANIEANPKLALEVLLSLQIPTQEKDTIYKQKFQECSQELKEMNDKNNSSVLVWSYMVNGLYQKTLNEIAEYANEQMTAFNNLVDQWKQTIKSLEDKVNKEKGKLGLK